MHEKVREQILLQVGFSSEEIEIIKQAGGILERTLQEGRETTELDNFIEKHPFLCEIYPFPFKPISPLAFMRLQIEQEKEALIYLN